ncbi:MAG TPA: thioesterase family protein [Candidatus Competibacteraceae bacterium]|nr:thioesterase family protein [Candidatus Competibacteraceae bacterium]
MQRADFRHVLELPVLWGHMDALGHVNNVQYFRYIESGRIAYFENLLGELSRSGESVILADMQCSFRQQLHYPSQIEVMSRVSRIGRSSLDLQCALFRKGENQAVATSKAVLVWFDFATQASRPIPEAVRNAILAFEPISPAL